MKSSAKAAKRFGARDPCPSQPTATEAPTPNPARLSMRKLIRSTTTKAFLTKDGAWTNDIGNAHDFAQHEDAQAARKSLGSHEVELYYSFNESRETRYDFTTPAL